MKRVWRNCSLTYESEPIKPYLFYSHARSWVVLLRVTSFCKKRTTLLLTSAPGCFWDRFPGTHFTNLFSDTHTHPSHASRETSLAFTLSTSLKMAFHLSHSHSLDVAFGLGAEQLKNRYKGKRKLCANTWCLNCRQISGCSEAQSPQTYVTFFYRPASKEPLPFATVPENASRSHLHLQLLLCMGVSIKATSELLL